jgi:murein DD-endopeptidase MepM/ murein hydrolase activator NlpD
MKPIRFAPRRALAAAALAAALLPAAAAAAPREEADNGHLPYYVAMDPPIVYPGAVIRLQVRPPAGVTGGTVAVAGRRYMGQVEDGMFVAYFAVDIDTLPGPYELRYDVGGRNGTRVVTVRARRMDESGRGERTLTREDLAVEELVRSHPRLVSLWNHATTERYWNGPFLTPNPGPMAATFAMRRATETSLGSPHTGVDLAARGGSDVVSAGIGVVAVVASGPGAKLVVVDHGLGLYTYYFGLGEVFVGEGQRLKRGAILGAMPESSRALLHFGARLGGAQVDPVSLPGITLKVPPPISGEVRQPKEEKDKTSDYDY